MSARLAEVVGALSLATDAVNGQVPEKAMRIAVLATGLARACGQAEPVVRDVYWAGILRYVGCTGFAVEEAGYAAGDDIGLRQAFVAPDLGRPAEFVAATLRHVGKHAPLRQRVGAVARLLSTPSAAREHAKAQCDAGAHFARKLGLSNEVAQALSQTDERYSGRGLPHGIAGEELLPCARIVAVAAVAETAYGRGGLAAAKAEVARRAGDQLDPKMSRRFEREALSLCAPLAATSVWDHYLAAEPGLRTLDEAELDDVCDAFAQFADLKSAFTLGHSPGVAELARGGASELGLSTQEARDLVRAAQCHDVGRVSVPTGLWDKPGPLTTAEWERVHLHAYWSERVLRRAPAFARAAAIAGRSHERLDGSGYHRGGGATELDRSARLLAACDVFQALGEGRAHRAALASARAADELLREVKAGRLCRDAVDAVLAAAGHRRAGPRRTDALSEREVEVLCLVAQGLSNKEVAARLGISPRTVQHHTIHIYGKIGVQSRAGAALWAVEQGLFRR